MNRLPSSIIPKEGSGFGGEVVGSLDDGVAPALSRLSAGASGLFPLGCLLLSDTFTS